MRTLNFRQKKGNFMTGLVSFIILRTVSPKDKSFVAVGVRSKTHSPSIIIPCGVKRCEKQAPPPPPVKVQISLASIFSAKYLVCLFCSSSSGGHAYRNAEFLSLTSIGQFLLAIYFVLSLNPNPSRHPCRIGGLNFFPWQLSVR